MDENRVSKERMRRRDFLKALGSAGAFAVLAACQPAAPVAPAAPAQPAAPAARPRPLPRRHPAAPAGGPQKGGTLVFGLDGDLDNTLDPHITNWDRVIRIDLNITEPLIWEPDPGKFVPGPGRVVGDHARHQELHFPPEEGRQVPRRHPLQRPGGQVQPGPHHGSQLQGRAGA